MKAWLSFDIWDVIVFDGEPFNCDLNLSTKLPECTFLWFGNKYSGNSEILGLRFLQVANNDT